MHLLPRMHVCHAWFHLNAASPAASEEHGTSEHYKKILSTMGFEPPTPHGLQIKSPPL